METLGFTQHNQSPNPNFRVLKCPVVSGLSQLLEEGWGMRALALANKASSEYSQGGKGTLLEKLEHRQCDLHQRKSQGQMLNFTGMNYFLQ